MAKQAAHEPWQDLERQAYHAYREWPIWLMLRERELSARLSKPAPPSRADRLKARARAAQEQEQTENG